VEDGLADIQVGKVKGVAVVELRVNDGGSNGAGWFEIKIWTDAEELTNM